MFQLSRCNQYGVDQLLNLWVPGFALIEHLADEVNRALDFEDMAGFLMLDHDDYGDHAISGHNVEKKNIRTGGEVKNSLSCVKAALASSDQTNFSDALSKLKKGRPFSPSHEMKRLRATIHLVSFWTSLTFFSGCISKTAFTFVGLGRMPSWLTTLPSNILDGTSKIHFFGLSFHWYLLSTVKVRWRLSIRV
jgi:hypothetical protein